ncbi:Pr6Pr family membrane protein [Frondihabitans cladoniiphilus]|uniref:FAR-17a/AIG1-like protein n=1 Tax=Frondihabitans cladoniiphilus TaxID=715785 RepID=A0ABP8W6K1_9MICO
MSRRTDALHRIAGLVRLLAAVVGVVALFANFEYVQGFSDFATVNYFSYFTQQSNMVNVGVLLASGLLALVGRRDPPWFAALHALVTTYVVVSGVVFAVIVTQSASHHYSLAFPRSSQVLHFWLAGYVLVDWIVAPGRTPVRWRTLWLVLIYPLVWGWFTLQRGREVRWYPYFFLDPAQVDDTQFVLYNAIVLAIIVGVLCALVGLSRLRPTHLLRHRLTPKPTTPKTGEPGDAQGDGVADGAAPDGLGVGDAVDGTMSR